MFYVTLTIYRNPADPHVVGIVFERGLILCYLNR
jgi:hypothetical protein